MVRNPNTDRDSNENTDSTGDRNRDSCAAGRARDTETDEENRCGKGDHTGGGRGGGRGCEEGCARVHRGLRDRGDVSKEMSELTEQGLKLLVPTYYKSEKELLKEAFRIIIHNNPKIRIDLALKLYNNKKTSLAKSAEIAGLTTIEFKEILADRGIKREIEGDEIEEINRMIKEVFG
jgi:predicted HTH domain antitoxin